MAEIPRSETADAVPETYTLGHAEEVLRTLQLRTLAVCAPFVLSYLRPGLAVLDCGCGPGSLTVELAERVAPGLVVGIDIGALAIEEARALARDRQVGNVRFEEASVYELPFPAASFDAVFSHAVMNHLREPARALQEMRRVLKPGGIAALSANDPGAAVFSPAGSAIQRFYELLHRVQEENGGNRLPARDLRAALLAAGFARAEGYAASEGYGTPERTRTLAAGFAAIAASANFRETLLGHGWATAAEVEGFPAALRAWGERSDVFGAVLKGGALGWADDPA
jgi:SAM-dependent methyltransferase